MDANSVTINELITQMINEARRLGFGETTIWRNWVHKAGMVTRYYRDHSVCLYDPAVTDAFVQETRQRYDAGAISKSHLKQIRQIAGRLNEFYVTGTLRIDTTMRGTRYELSSRYEHLVDLFITHQGYKDRYSNLINRFNEHMNAYVQSANNAICTFVQENNGERSGSTMALLCISPEKKEAVASNVGDSKVFLFRKNELKKISEDHNQAQSLVNIGLITEDEARTHKDKSKLTQHLGIFQDEMVLEPFISDNIILEKDDLFLICSDGLTDMLSYDDISNIIKEDVSLKEKCKRLVEEANKNGGEDNITVVLAGLI